MSDDRAEPGFRARRGTHTVELDGEALVWDPSAEQLHRLNPSATRIWVELSQWRTRAEVATAMILDAGVDRARVDHDVAQCVERLVEAGLLEQRSPG